MNTQTTTFAKIISNDKLWFITYFGEPTRPQEQGFAMKERFYINEAGEKTESKDFPPGINTKITSLEFSLAMAECLENSTNLQKIWKEKADLEAKEKSERVKILQAPMYEGERGWYEVTMNYCIQDFVKGGHKKRTLNGRIIADNPMDAYNKSCTVIYSKDGFWEEEAHNALITYVGVLTDEYLMTESDDENEQNKK